MKRVASLILMVISLLLTACGSPSPTVQGNLDSIAPPPPTATPPFRAIEPTEKIALLPTATPLPAQPTTNAVELFPTLPLPPTPTFSNRQVTPGTPLPTAYIPEPYAVSTTITNGSQIIFAQNGNLWSVDDGGTAIRRLTEGGDFDPASSNLVWTPGGDKAAFVSKKNELVIISFGKNAPRPIFFKPSIPNLNASEPSWSPDGKSLAFTLKPIEVGSPFGGEVWLAELQGGKPNLQKIDNGFSPAWSLDGRFLAYLSRVNERDTSSQPVPTATPPYGFEVPTPAGTPILPVTATPVPAAPSQIYNGLAVYTFATKRSRRLFYTSELNPYPDIDQQKRHEVRNSILARIWWSPDNKYIAFADQSSFVGVVNAGGGTPTLWAGIPDSFAVRELIWHPSSSGVFFNWNNPHSDDRTFLALVFGLGTPVKTLGESNPDLMSSRGRISILPSEWVKCPALAPAGDLLAYADPRLQALIVVRMDWTVYSILPGADCAVWSPDGHFLATTLKNADNMVATLNPDLSNLRPFSEAKGASQLYWQRPELLPVNPAALALLTPSPVPPLVPGAPILKPDQISPPAQPGGLPATARPATTPKPPPTTRKP